MPLDILIAADLVFIETENTHLFTANFSLMSNIRKQCMVKKSLPIAAVWCSPDGYWFCWAGIWVWDEGQAGLCMGPV